MPINKLEKLPNWLEELHDKNLGTLWQVVKAYRANQRQGTVGVKTRAMVTATGKKPYKQKKTGNARRGSDVSPIMVGGGVSHGPVARSYREPIPAKMAATALGIALARRAKAGNVFTGDLAIKSGKTKDALSLCKDATTFSLGKTLICLSKKDDKTMRAFRNLRGVVFAQPEQITAFDILRTRNLIMSSDALGVLEKRVKID